MGHITHEALAASIVLTEYHDLIQDEVWCAACGDDFEVGHQALWVPFDGVNPRRGIVAVHLACYQGEPLDGEGE